MALLLGNAHIAQGILDHGHESIDEIFQSHPLRYYGRQIYGFVFASQLYVEVLISFLGEILQNVP